MAFFSNFTKQFGGKITPRYKKIYAKSKHWDGEKFENLVKTTIDVNLRTLPGLLKAQFTNVAERSPKKPIPVLPFDMKKFNENKEKPKFVWFGHSVLLLQINGKNLLIDPMFGSDAGPISPFGIKRFSENTLDIINQLPRIDAILMTHDHYDHLDLDSYELLKNKVDTFFVALGVGRHLEKWGIPKRQITEFDWWQDINFEGIHITFTPSRHFAGRGARDRAKSFWGGWVFKTAHYSIYHSGDGGYGEHFKKIAQKLGPFDLGFIECGQYNDLWRQIHLHPEEAVQATIEAEIKVSVPVHWAGFPLALHPWKEPIERFTKEAERLNVTFSTPRIGEIVILGNEPNDAWYNDLE